MMTRPFRTVLWLNRGSKQGRSTAAVAENVGRQLFSLQHFPDAKYSFASVCSSDENVHTCADTV
jgi:hypothetical protein